MVMLISMKQLEHGGSFLKSPAYLVEECEIDWTKINFIHLQ